MISHRLLGVSAGKILGKDSHLEIEGLVVVLVILIDDTNELLTDVDLGRVGLARPNPDADGWRLQRLAHEFFDAGDVVFGQVRFSSLNAGHRAP